MFFPVEKESKKRSYRNYSEVDDFVLARAILKREVYALQQRSTHLLIEEIT